MKINHIYIVAACTLFIWLPVASVAVAASSTLPASNLPLTLKRNTPLVEPRMLVAGIGAIAGVSLFTALSSGVGMVLENHFLRITSVVTGAWVGDYLFRTIVQETIPAGDTTRLAVAGLGAIGGMAILNYVTGGMGAIMGDRLLSITGIVAGALAMDIGYRAQH